jgi:hypothetical protein
MLYRLTDTALQFARDDGDLPFELPRATFADISHLCANRAGDAVIVTAAQTARDVADVARNERGRYRAFRVDAGGAAPLTTEYTSTAIPLPDGERIAYSNGAALVVRGPNEHRVFKVGRFSWGPPSLSADETGRWVSMTRWKGDDRKLFYVDLQTGAAQTSKFSYYSYLFRAGAVIYEHARDVKRFDPANQSSTTLTTKAVAREILTLLDIAPEAAADGEIVFSRLTRSTNGYFAVVLVLGKGRRLGHALVEFGANSPMSIVHCVEDQDWGIVGARSSARLTVLALERYQDARRVEQKSLYLGESSTLAAAGWRPVATALTPDFGFQFLPASD